MIDLTMENIANGAIPERIQSELARVLANIVDPATPAKKVRTVTLKLSIKPNDARNLAEVKIETGCKLCPPEAIETSIQMGVNVVTGEVGASEICSGEDPARAILPGTMTKGKMAAEVNIQRHDHLGVGYGDGKETPADDIQQ